MRIYTKTGDDGSTALFGGRRLSKAAVRVTSYGEVDELNAALGWCVIACPDLADSLAAVQAQLFVVGSELAAPANQPPTHVVLMDVGEVVTLERWIDAATADTPPLAHFILPGGTEGAARLHLARAVCRRAERAVVALGASEPVRAVVVQYLNRLSDLLFVWARWVNHRAGAAETAWRGTPAP